MTTRRFKVLPGGRADAAPKRAKRKRKPAPITTDKLDPRRNIADRTFEIVQCHLTAEHVIEKRWRIRIVGKGGIDDHAYDIGDKAMYVGMISEETHKQGKWTPFTWGHIPVDSVHGVREILVDEPPPVAPIKREPKEPAKDEKK